MAPLNQFIEYAWRVPAKIKSGLISLRDKSESYFYKILRPVLIVFSLFFYIFLLPTLFGSDYESILRVAEFGVVGSGTLAILTFTFALANESGNRSKIANSGELLLKSTVTLILGLGLLPLMSYITRNHIDISNFYGNYAPIFDGLLVMVALYILIVGMASLVVSGYFFISGILELIAVFETDSMNSKKD